MKYGKPSEYPYPDGLFLQTYNKQVQLAPPGTFQSKAGYSCTLVGLLALLLVVE